MKQLQIDYNETPNQLPIQFAKALGTKEKSDEIGHAITALVSCVCGQCENRCGTFILKQEQNLNKE